MSQLLTSKREYKSDILSTNLHDAASTLIHRENQRLTIAFLLDGCFKRRHPQMHNIFQSIRKLCPNLVKALDPRIDDDQDDEDTSEVPLEADPMHRHPLARHRLKTKDPSPNLDTDFTSIRNPDDLESRHPFVHQLREAYKADYNMSSVLRFRKNKMQWVNKMSFATRY